MSAHYARHVLQQVLYSNVKQIMSRMCVYREHDYIIIRSQIESS